MSTRNRIIWASLPLLALACGSDPAEDEDAANAMRTDDTEVTEAETAEESAVTATQANTDDSPSLEPTSDIAPPEGTTEEATEPPEVLEDGPGEFTLDFAASADFFTLMDGPRDGLASSPHGVVQIYYSRNIESVIDDASFEAPPGTVSIKTQDEDDDGIFDVLMVMIKQAEGSNPDTNDWLYQTRSPSGEVRGENAAFCSDCHKAWPQTDSLGGTTLRD